MKRLFESSERFRNLQSHRKMYTWRESMHTCVIPRLKDRGCSERKQEAQKRLKIEIKVFFASFGWSSLSAFLKLTRTSIIKNMEKRVHLHCFLLWKHGELAPWTKKNISKIAEIIDIYHFKRKYGRPFANPVAQSLASQVLVAFTIR